MMDRAIKAKLELLFFELSETLKDPPTIIDLFDWSENVFYIMEQIKKSSELAYNQLEDLVLEVVRRAEVHVADLDEEELPQQTERTGYEYNTQVAFVLSEINTLKSI